tara:strand:- start:110 stop:799 length:690 start_codon:yes stop_codon:yes gene_type:complete
MKKKILLIGSGGSLINSQLGDKIDSFDGLVCRFNGYQTKGFENDVGSKCDIWCMNPRLYFNICFNEEWKITDKLTLTIDDLENFNGDILVGGYWHLWGKFAESGYMQEALDSFDNAKTMNEQIIKNCFLKLNEYCYESERSHNMIATTGLETIMHYISCNYEVYLVGFDSTNKNIIENDKHYYSDHKFNDKDMQDNFRNPLFVKRQHSINIEKKWIQELEEWGLVKRLD